MCGYFELNSSEVQKRVQKNLGCVECCKTSSSMVTGDSVIIRGTLQRDGGDSPLYEIHDRIKDITTQGRNSPVWMAVSEPFVCKLGETVQGPLGFSLGQIEKSCVAYTHSMSCMCEQASYIQLCIMEKCMSSKKLN